IQREVTVGPESGSVVPIYSGLKPGERVVTVGSFLLSAESLKLNPGQSTSSDQRSAGLPQSDHRIGAQDAGPRGQGEPEIQTAKILLTKDGYKPSSITVRKNILVRLTFLRQVEVTCGTEISIPEYSIKREL